MRNDEVYRAVLAWNPPNGFSRTIKRQDDETQVDLSLDQHHCVMFIPNGVSDCIVRLMLCTAADCLTNQSKAVPKPRMSELPRYAPSSN